jgi:hypothetical protein
MLVAVAFLACFPAPAVGLAIWATSGQIKGGLRQANCHKKRNGQLLPGGEFTPKSALRLSPPRD